MIVVDMGASLDLPTLIYMPYSYTYVQHRVAEYVYLKGVYTYSSIVVMQDTASLTMS